MKIVNEHFWKFFIGLSVLILLGIVVIFSAGKYHITVNDSEACISIYEPVCGIDGNTYSNECFASSKKVGIDYKGECNN